MGEVPKKYNHEAIEEKWQAYWEENGIYHWLADADNIPSFVVDTPPPTVSGSLHIGHVFSYTHADVIVRYQRMRGKNIMYPMGWDDNGLPTERRVQNKFAIRCNPSVPYDPEWRPIPAEKKQAFAEVSRQNFIEACATVTQEDEAAFEHLWRHLGLSVDWRQQYATIDKHCRQISQVSFLDLAKKGLVYSAESPTMWDVDYQTALAQADIEDREKPGAYHDIRFGVEGGGSFIISTTRPELLIACIAVVAHPDDERFKGLFGSYAITPLFEARVPIQPSLHADPEKGSGIMMVCTFGDAADVEYWKASGLAIKQVIQENGRFRPIDFSRPPFLSRNPERAATAYSRLESKKVEAARKEIVSLLAEPGSGVDSTEAALVATPRQILHPVKYYEKGDRPIEFITTRQWFIKILDHKQELLEQGRKIAWHPNYMHTRYEHWVSGLNYDWCISRQRYFGVPFPVWYPIDENGQVCYHQPIFAQESELPVDPLSEAAPGYNEAQRGKAGGFCGDPDVMDTWATSSLTPQIVSHWGKDKDRHKSLFPMDVRPQSHEIIRTWAFYTIAKAWMHSGEIPWRNVVISGWILDPDRKKMSKSKGNVVTPQALLEQYSSDAVRYWAARARLGVDTAYDETVFKSGRKLAMKLFNASRFVNSQWEQLDFDAALCYSDLLHPLDRSFQLSLREVVRDASAHFEAFDYGAALQATESLFWMFCDDYVELVKMRSYGDDDERLQRSAISSLVLATNTFLRLFAPVMPYITEEVWQWGFYRTSLLAQVNQQLRMCSIHRAVWPVETEWDTLAGDSLDSGVFRAASQVLAAIHQSKSSNQKTLKWPVKALQVKGSLEFCRAVEAASDDLIRAGRLVATALSLSVDDNIGFPEIQVELAESME